MPGMHPEPLEPMVSVPDASTRFRALHSGFFVMPNPWDAGTAKLLANLGFSAIATSSAGLAWTLARRDGGITRKRAIAHAVEIAQATGLPVNGDFESGYGETPAEIGDTILASIDAGVAGCSIEDLAVNRPDPLYDLSMACRRLEAARETIERSGSDFVLTGRTEVYFTDMPGKNAVAVERLKAYEAAGAHVVYAPGMTREEDVAAIVDAVKVPVNVIAGLGGVSNDLARLEALGVTRISLGSNLIKVALGAFLGAARALKDGEIRLDGAVDSASMNAAFTPSHAS
ncbi:isocitrate lyase/PEP mutase family protein [Acuticoccus kandeliae]|uniref:isocitrate lyase/PEP mutase family protein n=1 Tax=Acuticoccus kandeliae TaxID=2073160 RepID=UPI0013009065|nr:isocitrate lyase/phosphoenolpyruvate mutase family protein [Acuticoccus kandeliae]